ncbi:MAG: NAD(P)/FAD-dependent oxidoreductase [Bacillota bacterium]
MDYDRVEIIIVGAGVIGLAVAAEISARRPGRPVVLMDKKEGCGLETSSRNSEVIHAGIYYPTGSLKAKLCVEGKELLYRFCEKWQIPHQRCGKIIVANSGEEASSLEDLCSQARANGVADLEELGPSQIARLEPHIRARAALLSPSTSIINSHALMDRLEQVALQNGVLPAYCHHVRALENLAQGYRVHFTNPDGSSDALECDLLINCAGLHSSNLAALAGIDLDKAGYRIYPCKGEYFSLPSSRGNLIKHLIYPPPLEELTGLGIHATKTLDGRLRLGPNAVYVEKEDYSVNPERRGEFFAAVKPFLPFVEEEDLEPEMAGIRPKLSGPGEAFRDFVICEEAGRGLPGLINLIGIESPGLTASFAIARMVGRMVNQKL